jgi:hypothetical protein
MSTTPIGTVRVITVVFLEEDVYDGDIPRECRENPDVTEYEADDIEEAVRVFTREGLTFAASGNDWAANPDGSYISDYATGERREVTAHLDGFSDADAAAIIAAVG